MIYYKPSDIDNFSLVTGYPLYNDPTYKKYQLYKGYYMKIDRNQKKILSVMRVMRKGKAMLIDRYGSYNRIEETDISMTLPTSENLIQINQRFFLSISRYLWMNFYKKLVQEKQNPDSIKTERQFVEDIIRQTFNK